MAGWSSQPVREPVRTQLPFQPAGPRPHGVRATGEIESGHPRGMAGRRDLRHSGLTHVSRTWGASIPQTTAFLVSSGEELQGLQTQETSARQQGEVLL